MNADRAFRDDALRAFASLVKGVEELQDEWPAVAGHVTRGSRLNDLIGFLFATLPLSQRALRDDRAIRDYTEPDRTVKAPPPVTFQRGIEGGPQWLRFPNGSTIKTGPATKHLVGPDDRAFREHALELYELTRQQPTIDYTKLAAMLPPRRTPTMRHYATLALGILAITLIEWAASFAWTLVPSNAWDYLPNGIVLCTIAATSALAGVVLGRVAARG